MNVYVSLCFSFCFCFGSIRTTACKPLESRPNCNRQTEKRERREREKERTKQTEANRWLLIMASLPLDRFDSRHFHFRVGRGHSIIRAVTVPSSERTRQGKRASTSEAKGNAWTMGLSGKSDAWRRRRRRSRQTWPVQASTARHLLCCRIRCVLYCCSS